MAWCYHPSRLNVHPPDSVAECGLGLVRATPNLASICVDGGMYCGARAFLEIGTDGHFRSFERRGEESVVPWKMRDLSTERCKV